MTPFAPERSVHLPVCYLHPHAPVFSPDLSARWGPRRSTDHRREFLRAGVYVLSEPVEHGKLPPIYVGEAETIRPRLEGHLAGKDFWARVTFFVSKDANLNKAHVQYLESRLVQMAREAKRSHVQNANTPNAPALSEPDRADIEGFLEEMLLCFPVLGLDVFEMPEAPAPGSVELRLEGKDAHGRGYEAANGFVVIAGATARRDAVPSIHPHLEQIRTELIDQGVLEVGREGLRLVQDYEFDSPSMAAGVLLGRSANGRMEWKDKDGKTLRELQEEASVDCGAHATLFI